MGCYDERNIAASAIWEFHPSRQETGLLYEVSIPFWRKPADSFENAKLLNFLYFRPTASLHVDCCRWLFSIVNKDKTFLNVPFPLPGMNKERSIQSYEEHNRRVRENISSDRLLEYNVRDGYGPLCSFLNMSDAECPKLPFPKSNSARAVKVQSISSFIVPLTVTLLIVFSLFSCMFQKITGTTVSRWIQKKRQPFLDVLSKKDDKKSFRRTAQAYGDSLHRSGNIAVGKSNKMH